MGKSTERRARTTSGAMPEPAHTAWMWRCSVRVVGPSVVDPPAGGACRVRSALRHHYHGGSWLCPSPTPLSSRTNPVMTEVERTKLSGSWPATGTTPATPTASICASTPHGAGSTTSAIRRPPGRHRMLRPRSRRPRQARATVARRLCTIVGFYRYAEEEGLIEHSPAVHVRRPRLDYESHVVGLDRNELGACSSPPAWSGAGDHALIALFALNGLRVSEAIGADIDKLGLERGHRTLTVVRKGSKVVTMPLAPRVARAVDLAIGERLDGPILVGPDGQRLDRHAAGADRAPHRQPSRDRQTGRSPHVRHGFITAALDAGVPLRDVQEAATPAPPPPPRNEPSAPAMVGCSIQGRRNGQSAPPPHAKTMTACRHRGAARRERTRPGLRRSVGVDLRIWATRP